MRRSPSVPSTALSTSCPSRLRTSTRTSRRLPSSSTTRMRWRAISARSEDGPGDEARALVAALGGLVAIGEADEALPTAVRVERGARGVLYAGLRGARGQALGIGAGGQLDPDEEAA